MLRSLLIAVSTFSCVFSPARADDPPVPPPAAPIAAPDAAPTLPDTPAGRALRKFLTAFNDADAPQLDEKDFTPEFLTQVPMEKFRGLNSTLRAQLGTLTLGRLEPGATDTTLTAIVRAEKGGSSFRIPISTDDKGVINGLLIAPALSEDTPPLKSWEDLDERLKAMAGSVSFAALERTGPGKAGKDGAEQRRALHMLNADAALAVGSTFKLYILGALAEQMERAEASWDAELAIDARLKSLPSGVMQNEPPGARFPVREFALKMISISDNTATDHLLHHVGRERVERFFRRFNGAPDKSLPFLGTREMFAIKLAPDRTLVDRYARASIEERRGMIAPPPEDPTVERKAGEVYATEPKLAMAAFWTRPVAIDTVEWFVSTRDCCGVMLELDHLASSPANAPLRGILGANPGVPLNPKTWKRFYYKGGSEPGVLNLTWLLEHADGRTFALSMTLNDTKKLIPEDRAVALAARAIELLAAQPK